MERMSEKNKWSIKRDGAGRECPTKEFDEESSKERKPNDSFEGVVYDGAVEKNAQREVGCEKLGTPPTTPKKKG